MTRLDIGVNPISDVAINEQIPALEKRGVIVYKDIFADYALERAVDTGTVGKPVRKLTQEEHSEPIKHNAVVVQDMPRMR